MTPYISVSAAQLYFDTQLNTEYWDNASPTNREKALLQATRQIDQLNFIGQKTLETQEHEFPRYFEGNVVLFNSLDSDGVPLNIKYATCEQALSLLGGFSPSEEIGIVRHKFQDSEVDLNKDAVQVNLKVGLSHNAWIYVQSYVCDPRELQLFKV